jgi:hypothetical protein
VAVGADGSIIANRPSVGDGATFYQSIFISNNTDKGFGSDGTWVHVINAGEDFGKRDKWPYWKNPSTGQKIQGGHDPYRLEANNGVILFFSHHSSRWVGRKDLSFNVIYSYDYDWNRREYRNTLDQRYCYQLRGSTCTVGGDGGKYVSSAPTATTTERWGAGSGAWLTVNYIATSAARVSQSDYDFTDSCAERICRWMGINDTSTGWGRFVKGAIKAGLSMLFGGGWYSVYLNYEVSFTNYPP